MDWSVSMVGGADRSFIFGLIALQVGLIDQAQLVAAFQAWVRDRARPLSDHVVHRGGLDADSQTVIDAMVALHVKKHGADAEKCLAASPAGHSTRERLAALGDAELADAIARLAAVPTDPDPSCTVIYAEPAAGYTDRTPSYAVTTASSDGQRFRVLRPHASGGLGAVFVALDGELHREVALKKLLDSHADDPISRRRFLLEAEITGGLEHPGIVPVYGLGTYADGRPYYAMRFIRGDSLKEAIDRFHGDPSLKKESGRRTLELRKLLRRFTDVCNAIDYAHSRGVLHRDLKPGNIIVGKHGETLVVDWGLAKPLGRSDPDRDADELTLVPSSASGSSETLPGSAMGTPGYMSPEQARGDLHRLGPRSDVYSLGATLYCLLTGRPPFEGDDIASVLRKVQWGDFAEPRRIAAAIDPALEAVCLKAMKFAPEDRYATSRALADDIERWTAGQPVTAWQEPLARRARRWIRRGQTAVAAIAAAALVALAGSAYFRTAQARAKVDLKSAETRGKQRLNLAIDTVKAFTSDDLLLHEKQIDGLKLKLVKGATDFFGRLQDLEQGQNDHESQVALAKAYDELGAMNLKIGNQAAALAIHLKALEVRRALAYEPKADVGSKLDLARSLVAAGRLQRSTGDPSAAEESGDDARGLAREAEKEGGAAAEVHEILAAAYRLIAEALSETGDISRAHDAYSEELAIRQKLAGMKPDVSRFQIDLADSIVKMRQSLVKSGRHGESIPLLEREEAIWKTLAESNPATPEYKHSLASCQTIAATILIQLGRPVEARTRCERAIAVCAPLIDLDPNGWSFRRLNAESLLRMGQAHRLEGDLAGASSDWRRAVGFLENMPAPTGELIFIDAACHAMLSSVAGQPRTGLSKTAREGERDLAMALLGRAAGLGYRDSDRYRAETSLDSLRERDDFRLLMMDLAMPAEPFASGG
jgi:tetratricopeptide (TPR) repeat protein/tRNA A-37 threonylcarbamoyl transferase component Bud32